MSAPSQAVEQEATLTDVADVGPYGHADLGSGPGVTPLGSRDPEAPAGLPGPQPSREMGRQARIAPLSGAWSSAISALLAVSLLAAWGLLFSLVLSSVQEHRTQRELAASFRALVIEGTAQVSGAIPQGTPVASLDIPSIHLKNVVVVQGTTSGDLEAGPGHRRDTPMPGEVGVSVLMGRSALYGAPFARIAQLRPGARIGVATGEGTFTFHVTRVRRPGDPLPQPLATGAGRLTLVTSQLVSARDKPGARPTKRLRAVFVDATLNGSGMDASTGRPTALPAAETAMSGDGSAYVGLFVWLEALLALVVIYAWVQSRWRRSAAVLVVLPVALAIVWAASGIVTQLLPNLY